VVPPWTLRQESRFAMQALERLIEQGFVAWCALL